MFGKIERFSEADVGGAGSDRNTLTSMATGMMTHEIKNYVCTLKGSAALLLQRVQDPEQRLIVERISRVVAKLESLALPENAPAPVSAAVADDAPVSARSRAAVSLPETLRDCANAHFSDRPDRISWDVPHVLPPVSGDADRLEQVFLNLSLNAFEAGAEHLRVAFRDRRGSLEVVIEDDGPGCDEKTMARMFDPYFSTKGAGRDRGLGLFIVRSILADHGCEISARSKHEEGAGRHGLVFTLVFPPAFALAAKRPAPIMRWAGKRGKRLRSAA